MLKGCCKCGSLGRDGAHVTALSLPCGKEEAGKTPACEQQRLSYSVNVDFFMQLQRLTNIQLIQSDKIPFYMLLKDRMSEFLCILFPKTVQTTTVG